MPVFCEKKYFVQIYKLLGEISQKIILSFLKFFDKSLEEFDHISQIF